MNGKEKTLMISPSSVAGTIAIPPSKSQTLRAILFGSMASGESVIENILDSPDTKAMIEACRKLGADIDCNNGRAVIRGIGGNVSCASDVIDSGNSGLVLRFITAIGALGNSPIVVTGDHSICHNRPMDDLLNGLAQLGVRTETLRGEAYAPLIVKGPMQQGTTRIIGKDSQPVSALLMAAALSEGAYEIIVDEPGEKPWVNLTLEWLERLGVSYTNDCYQRYTVSGRGTIEPIHYHVPGDLSSCAFPVAAALVTRSTLTIENVDLTENQGDKKLFHLLRQMGAEIKELPSKKQLIVRGNHPLKGIEVDINDCIDAVVILSTIACFAEGKTVITNGAVAREKECDRLSAIKEELTKMGAHIEERSDGLTIYKSTLKGADLWSHRDHRLAMSLAIAAMGAEGSTRVRDCACIAKTYPSFFQDFKAIGAIMEEVG